MEGLRDLAPNVWCVCLRESSLSFSFSRKDEEWDGDCDKMLVGAVVAHLLSDDGAIDCVLVPTYLEVELA